MRIVAGVILLVLLLVPGWSGRERLALLGADAVVTATRVPLDSNDTAKRRLGDLVYLGGVRLDSPDPAFGGFSAMHVAGDRFTLLSDGGSIVAFRMDRFGRVSDARFGALPGGPGTGWEKRDRDSEAMTVDPATGRIWVAFERANAIWRYAPGFARAERAVRPPIMADWSANSGAESLVRLADGSFIVISESHYVDGRRGVSAFRFAGDPTVAPRRGFPFRLIPPAGYRVTDATELPNGDLLILTRALSFPEMFTAKLLRLDRRAIRPGAVVRPREVATFDGTTTRDNMEALAVTREGDATIVWLASDDNEAWFQRTLLLKFRLDSGRRGRD